jgi:hypothetical protein
MGDPADVRAAVARALSGPAPVDAATLNMACFVLSRSLDDVEFSAEEAPRLARCLLRAAGRVVIDGTAHAAASEKWAGTEQQVLLWLDEALAALGYRVTPDPAAGRQQLRPAAQDW